MRLDKFLADTTQYTRSLATKAVKQGRVLVNGEKPKSASLQISATDTVTLDGETLVGVHGFRYFLLNKPQGHICANKDNLHPLVFDLLTDVPNQRDLHTVGRLDIDTTGLLLITDDGQFSHHLTSPRRHQPKTYRVWLAEDLRQDAESLLENGIMLDDDPKPTLPAQLERISAREVKLTIHEGRYHQVKRMFAALGNLVTQLHRERVGALVLDEEALPRGQFRALTEDEIEMMLGNTKLAHK